MNYFNIHFSLPIQFTPIHMSNAIQVNFPAALLQAISINTRLTKSLSQITPTLPSLSPVSSKQLPVVCLCEYLIFKQRIHIKSAFQKYYYFYYEDLHLYFQGGKPYETTALGNCACPELYNMLYLIRIPIFTYDQGR